MFAGGEKMKGIMQTMGFNPIGSKFTERGDIYVGEREAWIGGELTVKGLEVVYFIVSKQPTHGTPCTYSPKDGAIPSRPERLAEAFKHAEEFLNA